MATGQQPGLPPSPPYTQRGHKTSRAALRDLFHHREWVKCQSGSHSNRRDMVGLRF